jgi:hypothetical protein
MIQPVAQTLVKAPRRKIWDFLGAEAANMGVEYVVRPFMRQADLYIAAMRRNALSCRRQGSRTILGAAP